MANQGKKMDWKEESKDDSKEKKMVKHLQPIVAACSVLPNRVYSKKFQKTIDFLCSRSEIVKVYIFYPEYCFRLSEKYPSIPQWIIEHPSLKLLVKRPADIGPATKIVPLLDLFPKDSPTGLLLFDDDREYPDTWFDQLFEAYAYYDGKSAVGRNGSLSKSSPFHYDNFNTGNQSKRYLTMKTTFGVIYPRSSLPESSAAAIEHITKYKEYGSENNDDMMLGSWCHISKTPIYLVPTSSDLRSEWKTVNSEDNDEVSLCKIKSHVSKQFGLAAKMIQNGEFATPWPDIAIFVALMLIVLAFFILLICLLLK